MFFLHFKVFFRFPFKNKTHLNESVTHRRWVCIFSKLTHRLNWFGFASTYINSYNCSGSFIDYNNHCIDLFKATMCSASTLESSKGGTKNDHKTRATKLGGKVWFNKILFDWRVTMARSCENILSQHMLIL